MCSIYMHAKFSRQTYFDMPIHVFLCFGIFNKTYFGIKDKNYDMYMFHVYWTYVHMQHA